MPPLAARPLDRPYRHSMQSRSARGVRHPAVLASVLHGLVSLAFAAAVCVAVVSVPSGMPRFVAPLLIGAYTAVSVAVMLIGLALIRRAPSVTAPLVTPSKRKRPGDPL